MPMMSYDREQRRYSHIWIWRWPLENKILIISRGRTRQHPKEVKDQVKTNLKASSCKDAAMGLAAAGCLCLFISSRGFRKALSHIPKGRGG